VGAPKATTNKLQRGLNAAFSAARVVSGTHNFDRGLSRLLHTELDVPEQVASTSVPRGIVPTSHRCCITATSLDPPPDSS